MTSIHELAFDGSLEQLAQVGGVRSFRLRRDLGVESVFELVECSLDELQRVTSIGPVRARQILGSAQGHLQALDEQTTTVDRDARIAVVVPRSQDPSHPDANSVLDEAGLDEDEQVDVIDEAVSATDVDPVDDNVRILTHDGTPSVVDEWYDQLVLQSFDGGEATTERAVVDTPWSKYGDGVKYKAAQDRNRELVRRANRVVIVCDGEYSGNIRDECERQGVAWETAHVHLPEQEDGGLAPWTPADEDDEFEFRGFEVDDVETWRRSATKYTGPGAEEVDNHPPHIEDDEVESDDPDGLNMEEAQSSDEESDDETHTPGPLPDEGAVRPREGSEMDLEPEGPREHLTQKPAETIDEDSRIDENDLEDGDPGGGKVDEFVETPGLT